ncbi:ran gtpase-activating protein [Anaeramoeba flamelloides]|uniref:Ran gtpase-activating protein n=1 Tax=Anaeramoeba flamelloides TaxID=1746091 RepID=A0AAV7ZBS0_9EUKA|nr:ran gtpase-activating protein [Anaeramoeba flamelloides]
MLNEKRFTNRKTYIQNIFKQLSLNELKISNLDLSSFKFQKDEMGLLRDMLKTNTTIKKLMLGDLLNCEEYFQIFCEGFSENETLKHIVSYSNTFGVKNFEHFCQMLPNKKNMRVINFCISYKKGKTKKIHDHYANCLIEAWKQSPHLTKVSFVANTSHCPPGYQLYLPIFQNRKQNLESLYFVCKWKELNNQDSKLFFDAILHLPKLQTLNLWGLYIDTKIANYLATCIQKMRLKKIGLLEFTCDENVDFTNLISAFSEANTLNNVRFWFKSTSVQSAKGFSQIIANVKNVQKLSIEWYNYTGSQTETSDEDEDKESEISGMSDFSFGSQSGEQSENSEDSQEENSENENENENQNENENENESSNVIFSNFIPLTQSTDIPKSQNKEKIHSLFLKGLIKNQSLEYLRYGINFKTERNLKLLCKLLRTHPKINSIDFCDDYLHKTSWARPLIKSILSRKGILKIDLTDLIKNVKNRKTLILQVIKRFKNLKYLRIVNLNLNDSHVIQIINELMPCQSLNNLSIGVNSFHGKAYDALNDYIATNKNLKIISQYGVDYTFKKFINFINSVEKNLNLKRIKWGNLEINESIEKIRRKKVLEAIHRYHDLFNHNLNLLEWDLYFKIPKELKFQFRILKEVIQSRNQLFHNPLIQDFLQISQTGSSSDDVLLGLPVHSFWIQKRTGLTVQQIKKMIQKEEEGDDYYYDDDEDEKEKEYGNENEKENENENEKGKEKEREKEKEKQGEENTNINISSEEILSDQKIFTKENIRIFLVWVYTGIAIDIDLIKIITKKMRCQKNWKRDITIDLLECNKDQKSKDFTINSKNGTKLKIHKFILLTRTGLFRNMFESLKTDIDQISDYSGKSDNTLKVLINYFYTNKLLLNEFSIKQKKNILIQLDDVIEYYDMNRKSNLNHLIEKQIEIINLN